MKVKLKQDQRYISVRGFILTGLKDEIVDIDPTFYKHIASKCSIVKDNETKEKKEAEKENKKEVDYSKMNKEQLRQALAEKEIELSDEEFANVTKANMIEMLK